ncbi:D-alanine--D-alanine ligase family protein [Salidesulfovibrio onnuriiensis]|uniref:D-alanine--D-alanine ligase family protein n=1 Tax=Salidesulfovibrio onnuriiensis TaxID=2583823 RepID=UPI0011CA58DF|nr:ATP-grasp domain-containing protein [Salidesulfovibrio onnuriiensis]
MTRKTVAIVRTRLDPGASADDLDVLAQSEFVARILRQLDWSVVEVELGDNLAEACGALESIRPDVVFNLVESMLGSDALAGIAPVLFQKGGLPFTGSDSAVLSLTCDKLSVKKRLNAVGLPTPWGAGLAEVENGAFQGPGMYIIKSRSEHASVGLDDTAVLRAEEREALLSSMRDFREKTGSSCIAERFIDGREFSVALVEYPVRKAVSLGAAEIVFRKDLPTKIVGYSAKWVQGSDEDLASVRSFDFAGEDPYLAHRLQHTANNCWSALGLRGYARIDFRTDAQGREYVIDVNANPCLSEDAGFIATSRHYGWEDADIIQAIIEGALNRYEKAGS